MVNARTEHEEAGILNRIRFRLVKLLYDGFFVAMVRDGSWQKPLIESLAPETNDRILDFGPGSCSTRLCSRAAIQKQLSSEQIQTRKQLKRHNNALRESKSGTPPLLTHRSTVAFHSTPARSTKLFAF